MLLGVLVAFRYPLAAGRGWLLILGFSVGWLLIDGVRKRINALADVASQTADVRTARGDGGAFPSRQPDRQSARHPSPTVLKSGDGGSFPQRLPASARTHVRHSPAEKSIRMQNARPQPVQPRIPQEDPF